MTPDESKSLGVITGIVQGLDGKIDSLKKDLVVQLSDHEGRIRASETWRSRFHGASALFVFMLGVGGALLRWGALVRW